MKQHVVTITAGLAVALLAAGCSSDRPESSSPPAVRPSTPAPTASPSPTAEFDGDGAAEIWDQAERKARRAKSFHVVMTGFYEKQPVEMDMSYAAGRATGTVTLNKHAVKLRRIGKDLWFQAERAFWLDQGAGAGVTDMLAGRWVRGRQSTAGLDSLFELTDLTAVRKEFILTAGQDVLYTGRVAGRKVGGRPTVGLAGRARDVDGGEFRVAVYVAADGSALPMQVVALSGKKYNTENRVFSRWNKKVTVTRPGNAVRIP